MQLVFLAVLGFVTVATWHSQVRQFTAEALFSVCLEATQ